MARRHLYEQARRSSLFAGAEGPLFIAGPCALESEEQALRIARAVKAAGASVFRGGAFKVRTSPYAFQGLGYEGLAILDRVRRETGLLICTEAVDTECLGAVAEVADIVQVGSRNMDCPSLLKRAGRCGKPVLLKRGFAATLDEWLLAAERVLAEGNADVILCERGIRTFGTHSRNTLDLHAVLRVRERTTLPVIVDPSHAAGIRADVAPLACAAAAVGADGIIVEVHDRPEEALCDGPQQITPETFGALVRKVRAVAELSCARA
jgi:3-deoxy-7-phosphoheptulonate synthase